MKLNDQIPGLRSLWTLGVRVLTVMEFVVRRSLQKDHAAIPGLHPENKKKMTGKPTVERLLKALSDVSLTSITNATGEQILRRLTPLSGLQEEILQRQGVGTFLYGQLEMQEIGHCSADPEIALDRASDVFYPPSPDLFLRRETHVRTG